MNSNKRRIERSDAAVGAVEGLVAGFVVCLAATLWTMGCGERKAVVEGAPPVRAEPEAVAAPIERSVADLSGAPEVVAVPETQPTERIDSGTKERASRSPEPAAALASVGEARPLAEPSAEGIPEAPIGQAPVPSVLASMPGYEPADDSEAASVETGRREVGPTELELSGGESSAEELVIAALEALRENDLARLQALGVTHTEFEELCWPEFPESRPVTGWSSHEAWGNFDSRNISGVQRGMSDWAGRHLFLEELSYRSGLAPYTNFTLYRDAVIQAQAENGEIVEIEFVRTLIERNGRWKIYSFKD